MYQYPYGNAQQLNLDWILSKLQELEAGSGGGSDLEEVANALVSASFDAGVSYRRYDYCFYNGKLYRALNDNSGAFDPDDWLEIVICDDIPVLTRLLNAVDASLTTLQGQVADLDSDDVDNTSTVTGATVTAALNTLNGAVTPQKISNVDLNTITAQGLYICSGGITNSPNNAGYGYLTVITDAPDCKQEFTYMTSMYKYYRIFFNGTWTAWSELVLADNAQLTGNPTAPTAPVGTNTTQIATTQFVQNEQTNRIYYKLLANGASVNLAVTSGHCYLIYAVRVATLGQTYGCWLIDSWGGIVTINNINNVTVTYADNIATITNNSGGYINVPIFDLYEA